jgi:hypothetical protein
MNPISVEIGNHLDDYTAKVTLEYDGPYDEKAIHTIGEGCDLREAFCSTCEVYTYDLDENDNLTDCHMFCKPKYYEYTEYAKRIRVEIRFDELHAGPNIDKKCKEIEILMYFAATLRKLMKEAFDKNFKEEKNMETIDLLVVKDEKQVSTFQADDLPLDLNRVETEYMTLKSTNDDDEYTGIDITLVEVNPKSGLALFKVHYGDSEPTEFVIGAKDDPIVELADELGIGYHIFENDVQYEINPKIKQGCLYKFQKAFTHEWFLAIVQSVGPSMITLNKLDVSRDKRYNPTMFELDQQDHIFGILASDAATVEEYKNYVVTKLCDLTAAFDDEEEEE